MGTGRQHGPFPPVAVSTLFVLLIPVQALLLSSTIPVLSWLQSLRIDWGFYQQMECFCLQDLHGNCPSLPVPTLELHA